MEQLVCGAIGCYFKFVHRLCHVFYGDGRHVLYNSTLAHYASPGMDVVARASLREESITHIVEVIDGFLLASVLLIFAMDLYELFISKIDAAEDSKTSGNVLHISSLDDLKNRLAKVILMILIVNFFEQVLKMQFETPQSLIYLSGGIALIGLALYLTHQSEWH